MVKKVQKTPLGCLCEIRKAVRHKKVLFFGLVCETIKKKINGCPPYPEPDLTRPQSLSKLTENLETVKRHPREACRTPREAPGAGVWLWGMTPKNMAESPKRFFFFKVQKTPLK
jgi:hypothetical protein